MRPVECAGSEQRANVIIEGQCGSRLRRRDEYVLCPQLLPPSHDAILPQAVSEIAAIRQPIHSPGLRRPGYVRTGLRFNITNIGMPVNVIDAGS